MKLANEAEALMLYQFRNSPKLKGLMRSLVEPLQSVADSIQALKNGLAVDEVSGQQLDLLGALIGQQRLAMSDENMRTWIKIRILLNRCQGTPEELFSILRLLLGNNFALTLKEYQPNDVIIVFSGAFSIPAACVFSLIKAASPLTIKHHFIRADAKNTFQFDTTSFSQSRLAEFF